MTTLLKARTYYKLGLQNLVRVAFYRIGLRTGKHPVVKLKRTILGANFFQQALSREPSPLNAPSDWQDSSIYFGTHKFPLSGHPPEWHQNPFTDKNTDATQPWWRIPDFHQSIGDIKALWELSRFDWVLCMAQRSARGSEKELTRLNTWLAHWCLHNPAFLGPNWKCGQEASIRVMHLALAHQLLNKNSRPSPDFIELLEAHLARIHPTVNYATAQDNNHATSEAAALFIGGAICERHGVIQGNQWQNDGRNLLEKSIKRLVSADGSFSQHSVNYHRLMLDTISLAELFRQWHSMPSFSNQFMDRARSSANWLYNMVNPVTGDAPNIGTNDGANLLPLTDADFRDFRPSVQLAMALFAHELAYENAGHHDLHLKWLGVERPAEITEPLTSRNFSHGGYSILRQNQWTVFFKYPRYKFRPSHCDALHMDLWHGSQNIFPDGGSFSYNTEPEWENYFPGTEAHNTVMFDNRDQMPAVGRFLRGSWLKTQDSSFDRGMDKQSTSASYTDWKGAHHSRQIQIQQDGVLVYDQILDFKINAVLRWRLAPGNWTLEGSCLRGLGFSITVHSDVEICRLELSQGWESRYYLEKTPLQVFEVELKDSGTITTMIKKEN